LPFFPFDFDFLSAVTGFLSVWPVAGGSAGAVVGGTGATGAGFGTRGFRGTRLTGGGSIGAAAGGTDFGGAGLRGAGFTGAGFTRTGLVTTGAVGTTGGGGVFITGTVGGFALPFPFLRPFDLSGVRGATGAARTGTAGTGTARTGTLGTRVAAGAGRRGSAFTLDIGLTNEAMRGAKAARTTCRR
jgi:hypothetical protein